jgi:hypothetical protein
MTGTLSKLFVSKCIKGQQTAQSSLQVMPIQWLILQMGATFT